MAKLELKVELETEETEEEGLYTTQISSSMIMTPESLVNGLLCEQLMNKS